MTASLKPIGAMFPLVLMYFMSDLFLRKVVFTALANPIYSSLLDKCEAIALRLGYLKPVCPGIGNAEPGRKRWFKHREGRLDPSRRKYFRVIALIFNNLEPRATVRNRDEESDKACTLSGKTGGEILEIDIFMEKKRLHKGVVHAKYWSHVNVHSKVSSSGSLFLLGKRKDGKG